MGKEGLGISFSGQVQASGPAPAVVPAHQQGEGMVLAVTVALREKICAQSQLLGSGAEAWSLGPHLLQHMSQVYFSGSSQTSHATESPCLASRPLPTFVPSPSPSGL